MPRAPLTLKDKPSIRTPTKRERDGMVMAKASFGSGVKENSIKTSSKGEGSNTFASRGEGKTKNANTPIDPPIVTTQVVSSATQLPYCLIFVSDGPKDIFIGIKVAYEMSMRTIMGLHDLSSIVEITVKVVEEKAKAAKSRLINIERGIHSSIKELTISSHWHCMDL
ncbi:hypothetical protein J1N35_041594 [Gossypium stocksii]|uniref:Uncharacterized protein n=1 Tax=Gossypium stocksii TaxID=47602 RepID=A0A9D3ZJK2_9ROSI|nr:hypothetical protein J1N35_041594 [Gossypium stocksii]